MKAGRVLITGATGAVGPAVVSALQAAGWRPRVLAQPGTEQALGQGIEVSPGDVTDPSALAPAMEGVDAVVHLAALLHETGAQSAASEYERVNVHGTRVTLDAARSAGVRRMVLLSTIAVYGDLGGRVADEETPPRPDSHYTRTKLAAEQLALSAKNLDGRPLAAVLRAGAVYGPRVKGNYRRLVVALSRRRFVPIGAGTNRRTLVFDEDLGEAVSLALARPEAAGRVFNVTDGSVHPVAEVVRAICDALGRRPPRIRVPAVPALAACRAVESAARLAGFPPPLREASLLKYMEDVAVSGARIERELGFRARYGRAEGWRATVAGLRAAGGL